MARRGVDALRHACRRTVAAAVVRGAQVRSTLHHSTRDPRRVSGVGTWFSVAASRVVQRAARAGDLAVRLIPVAGPLPDVPDHVQQSVPVRGVDADWCGSDVTVIGGVLDRELTLPG